MKDIIKIHLKKRDDYKNLYNDEILSYGLSNYILEETKGISVKKKIKFIISSDFIMSDKEKNDLVDMMRNNFGADISEIINLTKKELMTNSLLFLIGLFLLSIYTLLRESFFSEFILILSWLIVGESICNFFYRGVKERYNIDRRKQIVNAKVFFE